MKIVVISDIHGRKEILDDVLNFYKKEGFNRLFILGDILEESLPSLNPLSREILAVKGNCDDLKTVEEASFLMPDYTFAREFNKVFFLTHGHLYDETSFEDLYDVYLSGHTHHALLRKNSRGKIVANPGSISRPRDSLPSFIEINEKGLFLYDVESLTIYDELFF